MKMTNAGFVTRAKTIVAQDAADRSRKEDGTVAPFDVSVVWDCYILGNIKALLSTTLRDGMYYEVTYNAEKDEIYFDAYKKFENRKYEVE